LAGSAETGGDTLADASALAEVEGTLEQLLTEL
jgi:hypothetical protein